MCFDLLALPRVFQGARKPPCRKVQRPKKPGPRNCCPGPRRHLGLGTQLLARNSCDSSCSSSVSTAPSASRMTRILLVALSVAGRRAKQPTGAPNASHHGGKNSNCRRCVQNEGDISRWCGRVTARDQPGAPDILVMFPLVSIHNSP